MIEDKHIVMTDERLEMLADRFIRREVRELLHISFAEYIREPYQYDALVDALEAGHGLVGIPVGGGRVAFRVAA